MATIESETGDIRKQELEDITTCCICTDVYTNPKALPCIHTFCLKCLEKNGLKTDKGPGDEMPCPMCRRQFKIPPEGFHGLPKNFFIERLIQMANISDPPASSKALCDACLQESKEERGKKIPAADVYCVDCKHTLCKECGSEHSIFKLTKNHKLVPINEQHSVEKILALSFCELHEQKVLDVYCADCKTVVCAICFIDDHKNHEGSHVNKFVYSFRKQIDENTKAVNRCSSQAQMKKAEILKKKEEIQQELQNLECDVSDRKDEIKQLTDRHANSLLQDLSLIRQSKLKEVEMATNDFDAYLSDLESYNSYCQKILAKGSDSDICRAVSELSARAVEMQQQCQPITEQEIQSLKWRLRKSEIEEFLEDDCANLIGQIEDSTGKILEFKENHEQQRKAWIVEMEELIKQMQEQHQLIGTIITKASSEKFGSDVVGLAILGEELFVVSEKNSEVEIYDSNEFTFSRRWNLKVLIHPKDIGSCNRNNCLYIMDYKGLWKSKEILRVDPDGKLIKKWSTGSAYGVGLSVTDESNVILSAYRENKLKEYSPDGQLLRELNLSVNAGFSWPRHAVKLSNGHFVVCHGEHGDDLHRVCVVDADGKLKKSLGVKRGSTIGQLNCPGYLAVDEKGFVIVLDSRNNRVLLLDLDLEFKREILSIEKHGLYCPRKILLDKTNSRLFVADNEWLNERILIFDLSSLN